MLFTEKKETKEKETEKETWNNFMDKALLRSAAYARGDFVLAWDKKT